MLNFNHQKLISRKIWVTGKCLNFHTVFTKFVKHWNRYYVVLWLWRSNYVFLVNSDNCYLKDLLLTYFVWIFKYKKLHTQRFWNDFSNLKVLVFAKTSIFWKMSKLTKNFHWLQFYLIRVIIAKTSILALREWNYLITTRYFVKSQG